MKRYFLPLFLIPASLILTGCGPTISDAPTNESNTTLRQSEADSQPKTIDGKKNTAVVITENANLRKAPNVAGEVIQILPVGTSIEVLSQRGPWFLIENAGHQGWIHGNLIRLTGGFRAPTADASAESSDPEDEYLSGRRDSLSFRGYRCRIDCSGHQAGYDWAEEKGITDPDDCGGRSESFIEGCRAYAEEFSGDYTNEFDDYY